jgi:hypothetical protein
MQSDGMAPLYSIKHEWDGAIALITGASGKCRAADGLDDIYTYSIGPSSQHQQQ